jgi:hypothetical protein
MKTRFTTIVILALCVFCAGCDQRGAVRHTKFFNTHDAKAHFESVAKAKSLEAGGGGIGHSLGGPTGERHFEISLKGDATTRDTLIRDYKDFVEKELNASGVTINGRGVSGEVSGFDFNYRGAGATGIIRVNSWVDVNGYIQVDVFIYEHR